MAMISELISLHKSKAELLAKLNDPTSTYTEYLEISEQLRKMNRRIIEIRWNSPIDCPNS